MSSKPHGYNAVMKLSGDGIDLQPFELPADKAAAELKIVDVFIKSLGKIPNPPITISSYEQNPENDLDFTIQTPDGKQLMELTELAPREALEAGGFAKAPDTFTVGELADELSGCVYAKSRYGTDRPTVLLVYSTHYGFMISDNVLLLVCSKLATKPHIFERVIFFAPIEVDYGLVTPLFPVPVTRLSAAQRAVVRANVLTNFDPRSAKFVEGGGVAFAVPPTKEP